MIVKHMRLNKYQGLFCFISFFAHVVVEILLNSSTRVLAEHSVRQRFNKCGIKFLKI